MRATYTPSQLNGLEQALGYPLGTLSDPNFKTDRDMQLETSRTNNESLRYAREALSASRYASAIKSTISAFYPSGKNPIQLYNYAAQSINRIDQALQLATDPSNTNKTAADLDLVDAYVQIARGGQAITEAQVETLLGGLGIKARFDVATQKIFGTAILDDGTRNALSSLAHNIFEG